MIKIQGLTKTYKEKTALNNLSLEIKENTIFGLLGVNGAGKTTLISILNGLTKYDSGEVLVFREPISSCYKSIRSRSSLIPQSLAFYDNLTVLENLKFFSGIQVDQRKQKQNIGYSIEINRLDTLLNQKASTLSGGQKRRLNIAIGLLNDPELLFFDEPTVGIDPEARNEILDTIKSFKQNNKTIIYTSHYMPEIEKICDEVAILNQGKIVKQGDIATMLLNEDGQEIFIDIFQSTHKILQNCLKETNLLQIINLSTLKLSSKKPEDLVLIMKLLEHNKVKIKNINFAKTDLESIFIELTSRGQAYV